MSVPCGNRAGIVTMAATCDSYDEPASSQLREQLALLVEAQIQLASLIRDVALLGATPHDLSDNMILAQRADALRGFLEERQGAIADIAGRVG